MTRSKFVATLISQNYSELDTAVLLIWFMSHFEHQAEVSLAAICEFFEQEAISHPNRSRLNTRLTSDRRVLKNRKTGLFKLSAKATVDLH